MWASLTGPSKNRTVLLDGFVFVEMSFCYYRGMPKKQVHRMHDKDAKNKLKPLSPLLFGTIIIFVLAVLLFVYAISSGGIDGIISSRKLPPNPESQRIVAKRNSAQTAISDSLNALEREADFTYHATSTHDRCYKGQNNWKVKDGYAHRCDYRVTKFFGFNTDFRQTMIDFDKTLIALGWSAQAVSSIPTMITEYYDVYYDQLGSSSDKVIEGYEVSRLPQPSYQKEGLKLELGFAERDTKDLFGIKYAQNVTGNTLFETYDDKKFQDIDALFRSMTAREAYVVVVSVQQNYFQN